MIWVPTFTRDSFSFQSKTKDARFFFWMTEDIWRFFLSSITVSYTHHFLSLQPGFLASYIQLLSAHNPGYRSGKSTELCMHRAELPHSPVTLDKFLKLHESQLHLQNGATMNSPQYYHGDWKGTYQTPSTLPGIADIQRSVASVITS